jgi:hypothetical protein
MHTLFNVALLGVFATSGALADAPKKPAIDPEAVTALRTMGNFLRGQKNFTVRMRSTTEQVLEDGQKVQLISYGKLEVDRPNRLRADLISDRRHRQYYYDGKSFTLNGPRVGYYAVVAAPPTIGELVTAVENKYGLEMPLADLFLWGTDKAALDQITSATFIGRSRIEGVETDHYAFRQAGLDWQIWIDHGDKPVPRRLVLTTTDDPDRPQHVIDMTWILDDKHDRSRFTFVPPRDSIKIDLLAVGEKLPAPKKEKK